MPNPRVYRQLKTKQIMKHFKFLAMLLTAITFTACSNKDENEFAVDKTIRLSANIQSQQTRATMANSPNLQNTAFNEGAEINVYIQDADNPGTWIDGFSNGVTYTVNGDQLESAVEAKYPASNKVDVYAVYPKTVKIGDTTFNMGDSQSREDGYLEKDLMFANKVNHNASDGTVRLTFKHMLSKIIVKILPGTTGMDVSTINDLCMDDIYTSIAISQTMTGGLVLGEPQGSKNYIHVNSQEELSTDFENVGVTSIIVPQTVPEDTRLFDFTLGDISFSYYTDSPIEFKSGCVHTITLTLDNSNVKMRDHVITKWDDSASNNHSGNATVD